ncbi:MAG: hypothetical protein GWN01_16790 [Nitrosopumilaceae archaeon]|nr:hypothetical protein [Nitrosopumilaceae archaeon]NIU02491.1 hypothetical protein [Nitrosopumilaceae archaeon]NIU88952.1 hypothetical protein [Nitrosopumilaceae archaeon]NIV67063.1 hypothetical protein [Nitrosopumilaceae archaeon]NIX63092.1 hypothetical protein [Nitrosopumilaceae archaeon]
MKQDTEKKSSGKLLIILGLVSITILFVLYSRYQNSELITPNAIDSIQRMAYAFYVILFFSFGAIAYGIHKFHKEKATNETAGLLHIIALSTWNKKAQKIFILTFLGYGIFFVLVSGTVVYQPDVTFSVHYNAKIPSAFVAPCCDAPGYMPKIIAYLTEHVGLQIIPLNLVLQVVVSYLVGLNMSMAVSAIKISKKTKSTNIVGATTGLFIACPTCAGSLLSIFVGTAGGVTLGVALSQLQTVFIAISIPILLVTPFIFARRLRRDDGSCRIDKTGSM